VPAKKKPIDQLTRTELLKETTRRIRAARSLWDEHKNAACRGEREKALALYALLTEEEKKKLPEQLLVWLRYRSEKYFGEHRTASGSPRK
jgi:hypothetical protein